MKPDEIAANLEKVKATIAEAEGKSGRAEGGVELGVFSKTHPAQSVEQAGDAGQLLFCENRVQEAKAKIPDLPSKLRWHLIGHLQSNKARLALTLFEMIQGVDSLDLLQHLN